MATYKENPELISIINKGMAAISLDDKEALLEKWGISSTLASPQKKTTSKLKLTLEQLAWIKSHPIINVAADTSWFPFDFIDKNNVHDGLSQDVLEYIAKNTGLNFKTTPGAWRKSLYEVKIITSTYYLQYIKHLKEREI